MHHVVFPHIDVWGFCYLVLYPPPRPPARPPTHSLTHSHTHSLTHSLTHPLTHSLTHSFNHSLNVHFAWQAWHNLHCQGVGCTPWRPLGLRLFCVAGVAQSALPRGRMYALASLGSPPLLRGRRGTICTAKGSDVRPGVPWVSASFAWQAWRNVHCQGVGCTPWRPLGLRLFCVAGVAQCALPRGRMYALASLGSPPLLRGRRGTMCIAKGSDVRPGVPWVSASFAWQAWHNVHCQGVGCTPWRPLGLRLFCVAGVAQCALPTGSDVRPGVTWVSASFAWQAWDNVHCQGVGCTPWRPLGLRLFCVAGVGQCALPRGSDVRPGVPWATPLLRGRRGAMCTAKGSDVRPGVPWAPPLLRGRRGTMCILRGRRGTMCTAKGSDVRPGVPWAPPLLRGRRGTMCILRGRRGTMCTAKGVGCTPWRPLDSASFAWQAWDNVHFAWQAWDNVHCQGLEYALASLGLRLFCVAGAHSVTHSLTPLTPSHSLTHTPLLAQSHSLTLSHSLTHSLTLSVTLAKS